MDGQTTDQDNIYTMR